MLVLSRKVDESIVIASNIRLTVVAIRGNQVRIGIEAPGSVKIYREELCVPAEVETGMRQLTLSDGAAETVEALSTLNRF